MDRKNSKHGAFPDAAVPPAGSEISACLSTMTCALKLHLSHQPLASMRHLKPISVKASGREPNFPPPHLVSFKEQVAHLQQFLLLHQLIWRFLNP